MGGKYGRRLGLRILDVDGDDSETSDDVFDKCTELFNKLELNIPEACIDRVHRIGKKTPGSVRPIIVSGHGVTARWSIANGKIASIVGSLLT